MNYNINDLSRIIDLIAINGLQLTLIQDSRGYRIQSNRNRHITPILNSNETYQHLHTILNTINELSIIETY
jgi:hypothetical protein